MSKTEDYLEQLVNGADPQDVMEAFGENGFDDILEAFANEDDNTFEEADLFGDEFLDDDFLNEFEMEMAKLENESEEKSEENQLEVNKPEKVLAQTDDLDSILNGAREQMNATEPAVVMGRELFDEEEPVDNEEPVYEEAAQPMHEKEAVSEQEPEVEIVSEGDEDVLQLFEELGGINIDSEEETNTEAADIGEFAFEEPVLTEEGIQEEESEQEGKKKKKSRKEKKREKKEKNPEEKTGFLKKLELLLFGEDEEDLAAVQGTDSFGSDMDVVPLEVTEDANLALFGAADTVIPEEETKGKKKKEKKKREKKEKVKKEKKPKPKKEKKPKPPKEPDNTPPLPKKPVALIFVMAASFVVLVMTGADLLGYSNQLTNAQKQYNKKQYSEAFAELSGMEIKEEDLQLYYKYHVMAMVSAELEAYDNLMAVELYDMALDSLVRTIGRAGKYKEDAELYGCAFELNELELEAEARLKETFGISKETALEFYAYRNKKEYSAAIADVLKGLGLEM